MVLKLMNKSDLRLLTCNNPYLYYGLMKRQVRTYTRCFIYISAIWILFLKMGKNTKMLNFKRHCPKHYLLLTNVCLMQEELKTELQQLTQAGFFKLFKSLLNVPFIGVVCVLHNPLLIRKSGLFFSNNIQLSSEGEVNSGGYIPRREASWYIFTALQRLCWGWLFQYLPNHMDKKISLY